MLTVALHQVQNPKNRFLRLESDAQKKEIFKQHMSFADDFFDNEKRKQFKFV
jgi:hypothetical protein